MLHMFVDLHCSTWFCIAKIHVRKVIFYAILECHIQISLNPRRRFEMYKTITKPTYSSNQCLNTTLLTCRVHVACYDLMTWHDLPPPPHPTHPPHTLPTKAYIHARTQKLEKHPVFADSGLKTCLFQPKPLILRSSKTLLIKATRDFISVI